MHSASWDNNYDLSDKTVAVIGGGSSAVQIVPSIQPGKPTPCALILSLNYILNIFWSVVKKLIPFLRSPVWITTGFGAKFAGPGGTNFTCK
jgi:hypothetical protein